MPNNQLRNLASLGRYGDTMLAHINPQEAALLKSMGGAGTINPRTGLREFYGLGQLQFLSQFPAPEPLPSLGQALDPASLQNLNTQLSSETIPAYSMGGMGVMSPARDQISSQYSQYADLSPAAGMGGGRQVQGYTIPVEQTFAGKPLVAQYDKDGKFLFSTMQGDNYLVPDPSKPNIISQPRLDANGQVIDYGVIDLNKQEGDGIGSVISDIASNLGPIALAALAGYAFNPAAGNILGLGGGGAAATAPVVGGGAAGGATANFMNPALISTAGGAGTAAAAGAAGGGAAVDRAADGAGLDAPGGDVWVNAEWAPRKSRTG
jgi:hypothetical protein